MNSTSSGTCASEERFVNVCGCSCTVSSPLKILDFIRVTVSASVGSLLLEMWPLGGASRGYGNNGVQEPNMELNIVLGLQCLTSWGRGTASASDTEARMCPPLLCGENERRGTKMLAYLTVTCLPFSILNKRGRLHAYHSRLYRIVFRCVRFCVLGTKILHLGHLSLLAFVFLA